MIIQAALLIAHTLALPAAPEPKAAVEPAPFNLRIEPPAHHFYDRTAKIELAAAVALDVYDNAQTCHALAIGGHEDYLPTQTCAGVTAMLTGQLAIQEAAAYLLHRTHHNKLEKLVRFYTIEGNAQGIIYSELHVGTYVPSKRR